MSGAFEAAAAATPRRVRNLRLYLGKSEAEMAEAMGVSVRSYRALEVRQRRRNWVQVFGCLVKVTGVSLTWLATGHPPHCASWAARIDAVPFGPDGRVLSIECR